jgi:hypothetical protein
VARLYANENFPFPVVEELRRLGHDVLTIQETGQAGQALSDEGVLVTACTERRVLLTFNRKHFIRLHEQQKDHCGIIACTVDADFISLAHRIHQALETQRQGARPLIRINRPMS